MGLTLRRGYTALSAALPLTIVVVKLVAESEVPNSRVAPRRDRTSKVRQAAERRGHAKPHASAWGLEADQTKEHRRCESMVATTDPRLRGCKTLYVLLSPCRGMGFRMTPPLCGLSQLLRGQSCQIANAQRLPVLPIIITRGKTMFCHTLSIFLLYFSS